MNNLIEQMKSLAASYVPEWNLSEQNPDAGSVVALLFSEMLEGSLERQGKAMHKHKIQYLNMFDRFKDEPVEAAKSFVQFTPVTGAPDAVHIHKGTRLFAESAAADGQVAFETVHGITATPAGLAAIYATDGAKGAIKRVFSNDSGKNAQNLSFTAFSAAGENMEEHVLLLGFKNAFDHLGSLDAELVVHTQQDELEKTLDILCGDGVRFEILGENGFEELDSTQRTERGVRLVKERFSPHKAPFGGEECFQIAVTAKALQDIQISGASVIFSGGDLLPDEVRCGGVTQNPGRFHPFGLPMEIYAAWEIESKTIFARKGAKTQISFTLGFEEVERLLPEYEVAEEYKIIMKRPATMPKPVISDVRAGYVLLEYLSGAGWKRLIQEEHAALLFNGSEKGELSLSFIMPHDMLAPELAAGQPRLRFRLIRADGLYQIPCRQHCPVIENLRLSYSHAQSPCTPDIAATRNNFETADVTGLFRAGRNVTLFYSNEHEKPVLYFGFDQNPWGAPHSLYLRLENNADYPVDMTAEYLSPTGFLPLKMADGTSGMLSSGAMLMIIPRDAASKELFGQDLYWVRLINHNKECKSYNLPLITGVYLNMAKVENVRTQTQIFYRDSAGGNMSVKLGDQGLISAKVYVNEEDGAYGENWVLWMPSRRREEQGRVYEIDLAAGQVQFDKGAFAAYPVKEDGPAVKVEYQTYHGTAANVGVGKISSLASSIRYISEAGNPMPAYGGYDGFNEKTSAAIISNMLRTRGRAVTRQDYFDIISRVSYGVRRIKCLSGVNLVGEPQDGALTIAILIDEYEKGGHIFSGAKEAIHEKLTGCSGLVPEGKTLNLTQPRFVRMSARLWLYCERMEDAYDMQKQCGESIREFIDPLCGSFGGTGWEIGVLPTTAQLIAFLKIRHPGVVVGRIVMTAVYEDREYAVDDQIGRHITSPFAMAVNGEHIVYCQLMEG